MSDPHTGDHKSQWEVKENGVVRGAYSLLEPDGSTRIVEYIADDDGFRAVVKKIGPSVHPSSPVIIHPARLAHVTSLYDHSSGVYAGTKENYIAAYQPRPIVLQDNSAHSVLSHAPFDDDVRIFFNNHDGNVINDGGDLIQPEIIAPKQPILVSQPELSYVVPKELHVPIVQKQAPIVDVQQQILSVPGKGYFQPQTQIVDQAPLVVQAHSQPIEHQAILQQSIQHQGILEQPIQHQAILEQPIQHQAVLQQPIQHQGILEQPIQHQAILQQPIQHEGILHNQAISQQNIQHQAIDPELYRQQEVIHESINRVIQSQPLEHQVLQGDGGAHHSLVQQHPISQPNAHYKTEILYEGPGQLKGENLQLEPIPYKGLQTYKHQQQSNAPYDYDSY